VVNQRIYFTIFYHCLPIILHFCLNKCVLLKVLVHGYIRFVYVPCSKITSIYLV
jgi:hypothetical protein